MRNNARLFRFNASTIQRFNVAAAAALLLSSCANNQFHTADKPPPGVPAGVELLAETQIATLHFPAGLYSFHATDKKGFYYRAPKAIIQRAPMNSVLREGGIFVSKSNPKKLRGYVFVGGAVSHVGDLSRAAYRFQN